MGAVVTVLGVGVGVWATEVGISVRNVVRWIVDGGIDGILEGDE